MQKVYHYLARNNSGKNLEGILATESEEQAFLELRQRGLQPLAVDFSIDDTFNLFTTPNFSPDALAAYYLGLGLRIKNGMDVVDAVEDMADQPTHFRVKLCANELVNHMRSGLKLGVAMEKAGFPERDYNIIKALETGAKTSVGLENIANDYRRSASIQKKVKGMLLEPAFMAIVGIIAIWATMVFAVPIFQRVFNDLTEEGGKIPGYAQVFYHLSDIFDSFLVFDSILYFAVFIGLAFFLQSRAFKKWLDHISTLRQFSEMVDNAALWGGFRLLIDTSIQPQVIPDMLAKSASREDSKRAFEALGAMMKRGMKYPEAIRQSGFPSYIGKDAASAMEAPGLVAQTEALTMMNNLLALRVEEMADKVVTVSHIIVTIASSLMILGIMALTIMPVMITELHLA